MVKKKAMRKIKELSVVGSVSGEPQQQTPRKRGRPRKIVAQVEEREEEEEEEEQTGAEGQDVAESTEAKRLEGEEESENRGKVEGFASSPSSKKEEGSLEEQDLSQKQQPRTSRARRKNKPRKSS